MDGRGVREVVLLLVLGGDMGLWRLGEDPSRMLPRLARAGVLDAAPGAYPPLSFSSSTDSDSELSSSVSWYWFTPIWLRWPDLIRGRTEGRRR